MFTKLIPVITEKSMKDAKIGHYTFWVEKTLNKFQVKNSLKSLFSVDVVSIRSVNYKKRTKKDIKGRMITLPSRKKVVVTVKEGQKIDLFEEKKGKK